MGAWVGAAVGACVAGLEVGEAVGADVHGHVGRLKAKDGVPVPDKVNPAPVNDAPGASALPKPVIWPLDES